MKHEDVEHSNVMQHDCHIPQKEKQHNAGPDQGINSKLAYSQII